MVATLTNDRIKMPSRYSISKGLSEEQEAAFLAALQKAGVTRPQAIDKALALFCKSQGIKWPPTAKHGGKRDQSDE